MTAPRSKTPGAAGLLLACAALAMGGLVWSSRHTSESGLSPDLLSRLFGDQPRSLLAAEANEGGPHPPQQPRWQTPLRASCSAPQPQLRERLLGRLAVLRQAGADLAIDPTNYGERYRRDTKGRRLDPTPRLIVLHETVYGIGSAINTFVTPHPNDEDQVSYHAVIGLDGSIVKTLDPSKRAFGAGNSAFNGHWAITNPNFKGSVNNFALHVSLETPLDGENEALSHSGYTSSQYDALAVLLADWMQRFPIPFNQITTHAHVDLGGERSDPRSFDWQALQRRLAALGMLCQRAG